MTSPEHSSPDASAALPTDASGEDSRLGALVDEVLEKLGRGEEVNLEDYTRRHPQAADILRHALPALQAVAEFSSRGSEPSSQTESSAETWSDGKVLGDFRILRELGRGGMGVVYEAEQISLGRRVALKVLPMAGNSLGKGLQRFRNEVRAVAALEHRHIVSVYSVGEHQGVHYYAMQLIRGQTLAELIIQLRLVRSRPQPADIESLSKLLPSPASRSTDHATAAAADTERTSVRTTPDSNSAFQDTDGDGQATVDTVGGSQPSYYRCLAMLGVQAADALQHAHDHGVLHRDIKPGNLMLDAESHLYVTDFGLARIESDPGLTATGDVLGTLRYMSPEQALGQRAILDQRSDVYSLGATLYELFALQPMFPSTNRQELLAQIAEREPPKLRYLQRAIPRDLETIVAKATEKSPHARYLTCGELAEDLQAFLEHRPIKAKPASWQQRTGKWARRHRPVVATAAIGTALLVCVVIGLMLWALQRETDLRQVAEQRAVALNAERRSVYANLYKADIRLAAVDLAGGNATRLLQTLSSHLPQAGREDVRGWEWYYLLSRCQQEQAVLLGHCAPVHGVAWSPDDKYIATTSYDGDAKVWDALTFQLLHSFQGSTLYKRGVAWSPGGGRLAWTSVGNENAVRVWDARTESVRRLQGHTHSVNHVAWSPDGRRLASTSMDQTVKIWDPDSGTCLQTLKGHPYHVFPVCWSPDGRWIASGDEKPDGLRIWDADSGELVQRLGITGVTALDWSSDGQRLAVGTSAGQCQLWSPHTWTREQTIDAHSGKVWDVAWDRSGSTLGTAGEDGLLHLWEADGRRKRTFRGHHGKINAIAWKPDGSQLVSGGDDGDVKIWDARQADQPIRLERSDSEHAVGRLTAVGWTDLPHRLAIAGTRARVVYDVRSHSVTKYLPAPSQRTFWQADGDTWARVRQIEQQPMTLIDRIADGQRLATLANTAASQFEWAPDDPRVAIRVDVRVNGDGENRCLVWDLRDNRLVCEQGPIHGILQMAWSPDGRYLAIAGQGDVGEDDHYRGRLIVLDTFTGRRLWKLNMGNHNITATCVAWSPDGRRLAAGNRAGVVRVWDARLGISLVSGQAHTAEVNAVAWSPDGKRLASAGKDRRVCILDAATATDLLAFSVQDEPHRVCWHPAGTSLVSANQDTGQLTIWDASQAITPHNRQQRNSRLCFGVAKAWASAQDWEAAIVSYTEAIRRDPENWRNYIERGKCHFRLKQWPQVVEDATRCLERHTGYYAAYRYRADAYAELGMWQQAVEDYDQVLELIADHPRRSIQQQRAHAYEQLQP